MTGGTTSTRGHTTLHTASAVRGTGADIGAHTGACPLGDTVISTHGSTDGTTHGITEDIGEDGMIHGIIGASGDGAVHGTTEDIGECTIILGIRTMPDGTEASARTGDIMVLESDMAVISATGYGMDLVMRHRTASVYLREQAGLQSEEA